MGRAAGKEGAVIPATLVVFGRYWYDALTFGVLVAFFVSITLLLFRNTVLGWAMTWAFSALAIVFAWSAVNPPQPLLPEEVTIEAVVLRTVLIVSLIPAIVILYVMRARKETVVVGRVGDHEPCKRGESCTDRP
jgi:hypothetical protein